MDHIRWSNLISFVSQKCDARIVLFVVSLSAVLTHVVIMVLVIKIFHQRIELDSLHSIIVQNLLQRLVDNDLPTHELPKSLLVLVRRNCRDLLGLLLFKLFGLKPVFKLLLDVVVAKVIDDGDMVLVPATVRCELMPQLSTLKVG